MVLQPGLVYPKITTIPDAGKGLAEKQDYPPALKRTYDAQCEMIRLKETSPLLLLRIST